MSALSSMQEMLNDQPIRNAICWLIGLAILIAAYRWLWPDGFIGGP